MDVASFVCEVCDTDLRTSEGCIVSPSVYLFGDEPFDDLEPLGDGDRCRDCNTHPGHAHHFACCVAICRTCSDENGESTQRLFCDCWAAQADALGIEPPAWVGT